jgi:O-antigen/teichoic acid export membrane protein
MLVVATFLINSAFNLALGLLVARFLGPQGFGQYAVAAALAVALNTLFLDWIRLAATRFYSEEARRDDPAVRGTLDAIFVLSSFGVALLGAVAALAGLDFGLASLLLACAPAMGILTGLYDYHTALLRARFDERGYSLVVLLKNALSLALMVGGAWWFERPEAVAAGFLLSIGATMLVARRRLADPGASILKPDWPAARRYLAYGFPVIAATLLYYLIPLWNRTAIAAELGFAASGHYSLAYDLAMRLMQTTGSALDILLFQIVLRTERREGEAAAREQLSLNMGLILAAVLAVGLGFFLVLPSIEATVVPPAFRGPFREATALLLPGLACFALVQAAVTPVFQLKRRTSLAVAAALAALGLNLALTARLDPAAGIGGYALAQTSAYAAALTIAAVLAAALLPVRPHGRDVLAALAAAAAMAAAVWPLRAAEPGWIVLFASAAVGGLAFAAAAVAFDLGGCRSRLRRRRA